MRKELAHAYAAALLFIERNEYGKMDDVCKAGRLFGYGTEIWH